MLGRDAHHRKAERQDYNSDGCRPLQPETILPADGAASGAEIGSEDPATIRIDSCPAQHLDVASRRRRPTKR
jgi:hypothetical protein